MANLNKITFQTTGYVYQGGTVYGYSRGTLSYGTIFPDESYYHPNYPNMFFNTIRWYDNDTGEGVVGLKSIYIRFDSYDTNLNADPNIPAFTQVIINGTVLNFADRVISVSGVDVSGPDANRYQISWKWNLTNNPFILNGDNEITFVGASASSPYCPTFNTTYARTFNSTTVENYTSSSGIMSGRNLVMTFTTPANYDTRNFPTGTGQKKSTITVQSVSGGTATVSRTNGSNIQTVTFTPTSTTSNTTGQIVIRHGYAISILEEGTFWVWDEIQADTDTVNLTICAESSRPPVPDSNVTVQDLVLGTYSSTGGAARVNIGTPGDLGAPAGTRTYALGTTTTPTNWQASTDFGSLTRGTTYYGRTQIVNTVGTEISVTSPGTLVNYLPASSAGYIDDYFNDGDPDIALNGTQTSFSVRLKFLRNDHQYRITGPSGYATNWFAATAGQQSSVGEEYTINSGNAGIYYLESYLPVANGGSPSLPVTICDSVTVTRPFYVSVFNLSDVVAVNGTININFTVGYGDMPGNGMDDPPPFAIHDWEVRRVSDNVLVASGQESFEQIVGQNSWTSSFTAPSTGGSVAYKGSVTVTYTDLFATQRVLSSDEPTDTVTILAPPTAISFANAEAASANETVTVTGSGGSGGTVEVSSNNSTWFANGSTFAHPRGTSVTYYSRRTSGGVSTTSKAQSHSVGYLNPLPFIAGVSPATSIINYSDTIAVTFTATDADHTYRVSYGGTSAGTTATEGGIVYVTGSELPDGGASRTYDTDAARSTTIGGSGLFISLGQFTRTRRPQTPVVGNLSLVTPSDADDLVELTVTATSDGADSFRFSLEGGLFNSGVFTSWQASGTFTYTKATWAAQRGSTVTAKVESRNGSNASEAVGSSASFVIPYLDPDLTVSTSSTSIAWNAGPNSSVLVTGVAATEKVQITSSDIGGGPWEAGQFGNAYITVPNPVAEGAVGNYLVQIKRTIASGGNEVYRDTTSGGAFTITRNSADRTPIIGLPPNQDAAKNEVVTASFTVSDLDVAIDIVATGDIYLDTTSGGTFASQTINVGNGTYYARITASGVAGETRSGTIAGSLQWIVTTVNAGSTVDITTSHANPNGGDVVTLTATATDSDGTVSALTIAQTSGTPTVTLSAPVNSGIGTSSATVTRTFTAPWALTNTLVFTATATDSDSQQTTDTVNVNVKPDIWHDDINGQLGADTTGAINELWVSSGSATFSGVTNGVTATASLSGTMTEKAMLINGTGSWVTSATLNLGDTVQVRGRLSNLYTTPLDITLSIVTTGTTRTDTVTVTTEDNPAPPIGTYKTVQVYYDQELNRVGVQNGGTSSVRLVMDEGDVLRVEVDPLHFGNGGLTVQSFTSAIWVNPTNIVLPGTVGAAESRQIKYSPTLGDITLTVTYENENQTTVDGSIYITIVDAVDGTVENLGTSLVPVTGATPSQTYLLANFVPQTFNVPLNLSVSGTAATTSRVGNQGSATASNKTVYPGNRVYIYGVAPSDYNQTSTATVNLGGVIESTTIDTIPNPDQGTKIPIGISFADPISLDTLRKFFGGPNVNPVTKLPENVSLSDYYRGGLYVPNITSTPTPNNLLVPTSGTISLGAFHDSCTTMYFSQFPPNYNANVDTSTGAAQANIIWDIEDFEMGFGTNMKYNAEFKWKHEFIQNELNAGTVAVTGNANGAGAVDLLVNDPYDPGVYLVPSAGTVNFIVNVNASALSERFIRGRVTLTARHRNYISYTVTAVMEYTVNVYGP